MRKQLLVEENRSRLKKQRLDDEACWKCQINYKQGIFSLRPSPFPSSKFYQLLVLLLWSMGSDTEPAHPWPNKRNMNQHALTLLLYVAIKKLFLWDHCVALSVHNLCRMSSCWDLTDVTLACHATSPCLTFQNLGEPGKLLKFCSNFEAEVWFKQSWSFVKILKLKFC